MKKSSKILGSVALSAALVMGTAAPAFADTATNADDLQDDLTVVTKDARVQFSAGTGTATHEDADGASTLVTVGTYTSQINVTIPVSLPLYFDTAGGPGIAPANGAYKIINKSTAEITVQKADFEMKDMTSSPKWKFGNTAYTSGATSARVSGSGSMGDVFVSITPAKVDDRTGTDKDKSGYVADTSKTSLDLKAGTNTGQSATKSWQENLGWVIAGTTAETGTEYPFAISASSTQLSQSLTTFEDIATITYTVGVGTSSAGNLDQNDPDTPAKVIGATSGVSVKTLKTLFGNGVSFVKADGSALASDPTESDTFIVTKIQSSDKNANYFQDLVDPNPAYKATPTPNTKDYKLFGSIATS